MWCPKTDSVMDVIHALRQHSLKVLPRFRAAATDTTKGTNSALQKVFHISELKLLIFHQLPVEDLLVATQVCKEWQDIIVGTTTLRNGLLYGTLSFQHAVRIYQAERAAKRPLAVPGTLATSENRLQHRDCFFRVPQIALVNGEWVDGTLVIFRCNDIHVKLRLWNKPGFQLPKNTKAHLFADEILYWGSFHETLGCGCKHLPRSHFDDVVSGQSLQQKDYFDKNFGEMLQKDVCHDKDCFWEAGQRLDWKVYNDEVEQGCDSLP